MACVNTEFNFSFEKKMDMPKLNDARRIARIAMVLDELYAATGHDTQFIMSKAEFVMCGGSSSAKEKEYSFYRQLVYATRDFRAYMLRGKFVSASAIAKTNKLFYFRNKIECNEANAEDMKTKDFNKILRILILLQKLRKRVNNRSTFTDVKRIIDSSSLSYKEFVLAGGKKTKNFQPCEGAGFNKLLSYALDDMRMFLDRGRMPPPCVVNKAWNNICHDRTECPTHGSHHMLSRQPSAFTEYIDDSDEEDVDEMDGYCRDVYNSDANNSDEANSEYESDCELVE